MRPLIVTSALCVLAAADVNPLLYATPQASAQAPYDAIVAGMSCKQSRNDVAPAPQLECTYRVGTGLLFQLVGVGESDVNIGVRKAGDQGTADYVFDFSMEHRCVIVSAGNRTQRASERLLIPGFVSLKTGKVFRSWQECSRG